MNPRLEAITLRQLRALDAVAQARSITGAAQALGLTAPAVHSQLRVLEDAVGAALVFRDGAHAFQPTPAGAALLLGARR
ncbi:LysR family transcriptional regulator, partial [Paracoccus solventivorans]|uniref:helix-turn-helix domain-containing protein n=1 Tax=Paracoccus solventivorans TaxID=53463 RepID=UPI0026F23C45